jgi:polyisoprenoid-binding protein YceI
MFGRLRRRYARQGEPIPMALNGGLLSTQVRDHTGRALAGAQVTMRHKRTQQVSHATADEFGAVVTTLAPGSYSVTASTGGYRAATQTVEITVGDHAALGPLSLEPDGNLRLPDPGEWMIDPDHTAIRFVARHIAMSRVHGRFTNFQGSIHVGERIEDSHVNVLIDAASITTATPKRDDHLRSADFLDVTRFPHLQFVSDRVRQSTGDRWAIDGHLTMHGATRAVRLDTTYLGLRSWNGARFGAVAKAELHREHFTMNYQQMLTKGLAVIGSTIDITLDIQAILKP